MGREIKITSRILTRLFAYAQFHSMNSTFTVLCASAVMAIFLRDLQMQCFIYTKFNCNVFTHYSNKSRYVITF
jgi:hypothetical protein